MKQLRLIRFSSASLNCFGAGAARALAIVAAGCHTCCNAVKISTSANRAAGAFKSKFRINCGQGVAKLYSLLFPFFSHVVPR